MLNPLIDAIRTTSDNPATRYDRVAAAFYKDSRINRMAAFYANRKGLTELDEIKQEAIIVFNNRWLEKLDRPENVYFVFGQIFELVCLGLKRTLISHNEGRYTSLDQGGDDTRGAPSENFEMILRRDDDSIVNADEDCIERLENKLTKDALVLDVRRRLSNDKRLGYLDEVAAALEKKHGIGPGNPNADTQSTEPQRPRVLSKRVQSAQAEIQRLAEIRKELGIKIQEFAKLLNTTKGALSSYLYGRAAPPKEIITSAESIFRERGCMNSTASQQYEGRTMHEIALAWGRQLGATEETLIEVLSKSLKIAPVTIKRWVAGRTRPSIEALQEYEKRIVALANASSTKTGSNGGGF